MKIILRTIALAGLTASLTACALLGEFGIGQQTKDTGRGILTAYELAQRGALIYGDLPLCKPAAPAVKICRDQEIWNKIKSAEDAATAAIVAAQPVLRGDKLDAGELANALLKIKAVSNELAGVHTQLGK